MITRVNFWIFTNSTSKWFLLKNDNLGWKINLWNFSEFSLNILLKSQFIINYLGCGRKCQNDHRPYWNDHFHESSLSKTKWLKFISADRIYMKPVCIEQHHSEDQKFDESEAKQSRLAIILIQYLFCHLTLMYKSRKQNPKIGISPRAINRNKIQSKIPSSWLNFWFFYYTSTLLLTPYPRIIRYMWRHCPISMCDVTSDKNDIPMFLEKWANFYYQMLNNSAGKFPKFQFSASWARPIIGKLINFLFEIPV